MGNLFLSWGIINNIEELDTIHFFSREVVVAKASLGGIKRHHKNDTSNLNKALILSKNVDLPPFN